MFLTRWLLTTPKSGLTGQIMALGLTFLLPMETAMAQAKDHVESRNEAPVEAAFDDWKNGTGSPYDLLADDATWTIVGNSLVSRTYTSREDFLSNVIRPFGARLSGRFVPTIRNVYSDGDTVIIYFDAEGTAPTESPIATPMRGFSHCWMARSPKPPRSSTVSRSTISDSA